MSTKSTLLLTAANEHWYVESNPAFNYPQIPGVKDMKDVIVLEFGHSHGTEDMDCNYKQIDGILEVIVLPDTPLYEALMHSDLREAPNPRYRYTEKHPVKGEIEIIVTKEEILSYMKADLKNAGDLPLTDDELMATFMQLTGAKKYEKPSCIISL